MVITSRTEGVGVTVFLLLHFLTFSQFSRITMYFLSSEKNTFQIEFYIIVKISPVDPPPLRLGGEP